jgi:hypothetical protein
MHHEIIRHQRKIDNLFSRVSSLSSDLELQSYWSRFLCILVSGFLEVSIQRIFREYAQTKSAPHVARYVSRQLEFFQNPKMEKIFQLIGSFNPEWEEAFRNNLDEKIVDSVNSVVANRNLIVGVSYVTMKQFYEDTVKLVVLLDQQCNQK